MSAGLTVILGGGGVGKTTMSAALGLTYARLGKRVLVITIDPARRLADILGVALGTDTTRVFLEGTELYARMPDPRHSVEKFAQWLFAGDAIRGERVRRNPLYRELSDALVGMHELVCVTIVDQELRSGYYDQVILDTAPSRHALDFIDYPARLVSLLETRTLRWVAQLAANGGPPSQRPGAHGLVAWGRRRLQTVVASLVGAPAIRDVAEFFGDLMAVRARWLELLKGVEQRLNAEHTRFWVVAGPSGAALDDAEYLIRGLEQRSLAAERVLINRVPEPIPAWLGELEHDSDHALGRLIRDYLDDYQARHLQARRARERITRLISPGTTLECLPALRTADPRAILEALADTLGRTQRGDCTSEAEPL